MEPILELLTYLLDRTIVLAAVRIQDDQDPGGQFSDVTVWGPPLALYVEPCQAIREKGCYDLGEKLIPFSDWHGAKIEFRADHDDGRHCGRPRHNRVSPTDQ